MSEPLKMDWQPSDFKNQTAMKCVLMNIKTYPKFVEKCVNGISEIPNLITLALIRRP